MSVNTTIIYNGISYGANSTINTSEIGQFSNSFVCDVPSMQEEEKPKRKRRRKKKKEEDEADAGDSVVAKSDAEGSGDEKVTKKRSRRRKKKTKAGITLENNAEVPS